MAEIIQQEQTKKGRPKKHSTHIDMTPMVDLMCLLITFFMLTTAFSKPKVMEITMPEKTEEKKPDDGTKVFEGRVFNILITKDDGIYWYTGNADPKKLPLPTLNKTDYSKDGLRKVLLEKNKDLFLKIAEYKEKRVKGDIIVADSLAKKQITDWKKLDKKGPVVLIKADEFAKYRNIVDIVDEMAICNIASYAIVDIGSLEIEMLKTAPK